MVKYPEFDKREKFGSSSSGETPAATLEDPIALFSVVMVQHKGMPFRVRLAKVVARGRFEGHVLGPLPPALEIEDLESGCIIGFGLDDVWASSGNAGYFWDTAPLFRKKAAHFF